MINPWLLSAQVLDIAVKLMEADPGLHPYTAVERAACWEGISPVPADSEVDALDVLETATIELVTGHVDMFISPGADPLNLMDLTRDETIPAAREAAARIRAYVKD
ncbi:hypothetical protein ACQEVF_17830 [Nonomuraea polychroma]|uniref:hypothetical protein n=1 Tax=Nonomuraea polychroma TaxID=46176 RepID=UPI003D90645A